MPKPLLSQICHDLRAPLAAVTMGAGFVQKTTVDDARTQRVVEAMLRSCAQMERLIRSFADLSEIEAGAVRLDLVPHEASALVDTVLDAVTTDKAIELESSLPEEKLVLHCDPQRLERAIGHLLKNAVEHAPNPSTVSLDVMKHDTHVTFTVRDRGPGPGNPDVLFDREKQTKPGYGLAIARGFARAHGGDLVFERKEDESVFTLSIAT